MAVVLKRRLLTVEEYQLMAEVGILKERGIELINGEIIEMSPVGSKHAATVEKAKDFLVLALQGKALVRVQNPLTLDTLSELEPDIAIVKSREDYYLAAHPTAEDTLLIIEVANSSLDYDREIKAPLYARNGVPEYWILNLLENQLEVFHSPENDVYKHQATIEFGGQASATTIDLAVELRDLFIG